MKIGLHPVDTSLYSQPETTSVDHIFFDKKIIRVARLRKTYTVRNVFVDTTLGFVKSTHGQHVVESSSWAPADSLILSTFSRKSKVVLTGSWIVLPSNPYYHWLIEDLPAVLESLRINPAASILVAKSRPSYVSDYLLSSGRKYREGCGWVQVEELTFTDKQTISGTPQSADIESLQKLSEQLSINIPKDKVKIYVSRVNSRRSLPNERQIEMAFSAKGYQIVRLEEKSFLEQIQIFKGAGTVVGAHGAGLANVVFCSKGTKVIEILDMHYPNNCIEILAQKAELDFSRVIFDGKKEMPNLDKILSQT